MFNMQSVGPKPSFESLSLLSYSMLALARATYRAAPKHPILNGEKGWEWGEGEGGGSGSEGV